jgi:putative membrane protein
MAKARNQWRRYLAAGTLWATGLGLIIALILQQNSADLWDALAVAGWYLPVFFVSHAITILLDSLGWRATIIHPGPLGLISLMIRRWVGMSVNALLPVAQLGGEVVRAHLLRHLGPDGPAAAASVIVDLTIGMLTQILFALIGLTLLTTVLGFDAGLANVAIGLAIFTALIITFAVLQQRGLIAGLVQPIARLVKRPAWQRVLDNADQLDERIGALYRQGDRLLVCGGWRLLGWLWPSLEFWLLFWLLGHPISIAEAIMLEATAQVVRSAGFGIPGGLGVQEGGVMLAAAWLGIPTELALAAMLIRRVREFAYSLAGLLAWLVLESGKKISATSSKLHRLPNSTR